MNRPFVSLRPEITRTHAFALMDWLEDDRVTRYLSDPHGVSRFIEQAIERTPLPILTHLFNQGGRFFMVHDRNDKPVGFVRLIKTGTDCEIVLVIGDHDSWGQRLGASAIRAGLKLAFLDMRARRVIARIHPDNARSLRAFARCGFSPLGETPTLLSLALTIGQYLQRLRSGVMAEAAEIHITEIDKTRLESLIALEEGPTSVELEHEIERAIVVDPHQIAGDVVTMNSRVVLQVNDEPRQVTLVYPEQADDRAGRLSVLSEVGAAILGYREGGAVDWIVADRTRRIVIDRILYQPESAGHYHL